MSCDRASRARPVAGGPGAWVFVAGPSGAGKDTLMDLAGRELHEIDRVQIARRIVTRVKNSFEDHDTVTESQFRSLRDAGQLALWWQAHGLFYGIDRQWQVAVDGGAIVVANVSRRILNEVRLLQGRVRIVLVTAPIDVLAQRVAARGRDKAVGERLSRSSPPVTSWSPDLVIENTGTPEQGAAPLIALLRDMTGAGGHSSELRPDVRQRPL